MKYLNLGCGDYFHPAWTNVDFNKTGKDVIAYNLIDGIPFAAETFDVVYHSHLIEHLTYDQSTIVMEELSRVLKPGGILRIATPDFEFLANKYLEALEKAFEGEEGWDANYKWIKLHLFDQLVRHHSGGEMAKYIQSDNISNFDYVASLLGPDASIIREASKVSSPGKVSIVSELIRKEGIISTLQICVQRTNFFRHLKNAIVKLLLGKEYRALQIGRFRLSGECHLCPYDKYSLRILLEKFNFKNISFFTANESRIPGWNSYCLDSDKDGVVYHPDSIYIEGVNK